MGIILGQHSFTLNLDQPGLHIPILFDDRGRRVRQLYVSWGFAEALLQEQIQSLILDLHEGPVQKSWGPKTPLNGSYSTTQAWTQSLVAETRRSIFLSGNPTRFDGKVIPH